jgi:hypothetical protein
MLPLSEHIPTVYPDQLRSEYFEPRGLVRARDSLETKPFKDRPCVIRALKGPAGNLGWTCPTRPRAARRALGGERLDLHFDRNIVAISAQAARSSGVSLASKPRFASLSRDTEQLAGARIAARAIGLEEDDCDCETRLCLPEQHWPPLQIQVLRSIPRYCGG